MVNVANFSQHLLATIKYYFHCTYEQVILSVLHFTFVNFYFARQNPLLWSVFVMGKRKLYPVYWKQYVPPARLIKMEVSGGPDI